MTAGEVVPEPSVDWQTRWQRLQAWLVARGITSDRLNPILVKEARQALKSRQFGLTFSLLLIFVWGWTVMGVSARMPGIYYRSDGPFMLQGYSLILGVPLMLIVPFSAFRSLAGEREDGTFELVSITTLSSKQIVLGKLASAMMQMLVYFSATSPCMAFTYMLRGVEISQILLILFYAFTGSVVLSSAALLMATVTRSKQWNVLISVLVLAFLFWMAGLWCAFSVGEFSRMRLNLNDVDFWIETGFIMSAAICLTVFCIFSTAAQISFESDNRSTGIRMILFISQVIFAGWMTYFGLTERRVVLEQFIVGSGLGWFVAGALMSGERGKLSPRVRRRLPQTVVGRLFLTWFNPGSGSGFVLATTCLFATLCLALTVASPDFVRNRGMINYRLFLVALMVMVYVVSYLGVGRLVMLLVNRWVNAGLALPFLVHVVLMVVGILIPLALQNWLITTSAAREYSSLQFTNWAWTLATALDGELEAYWLVPLLGITGALVLYMLNLVLAIQEVNTLREVTPERVEQEDRELHPERYPEPRKPRSPWDDDADD